MNKENGHLNIDNNIISSTLTSTSFPNVNHLIDSSNSNCYSSGDSDNNNLEHQHFNNKKIISDPNVGLNSTFTLMDNNVQQQQTYELNNIIMKNDDDVVEKLRKQPDIEIESTTTTAMNSVQKTNDKQQQLNTNELSNRPSTLTTMVTTSIPEPISSDSNKITTMNNNNNNNNEKHQSHQQLLQQQQQQEKRSMFLTIDHKLAIRRRNIGAIRSYEECEIMSSNVPSTISTLKSSTDDISKSMTILSSNDINNNNNDKKCLTSEFVKNRISSLQQNMSVINNDNDNINIMDLDNQNQQPLIHESEPLAQTFIENLKKILTLEINMGSFIRRSLITIFMAIFISVVQTYTWITLPIYYLLQKPWLKRKLNLRNRVKIYNPSSAPLTTIPSVESDSNNNNQSINKLSLSPIYIRDDCGEYNHPLYSFKTVNDIIENLTNLHGSDQPCLGYRQVLSEEIALDSQGQERRMDGRQLKQYHLSDYKWLTYSQLDDIRNNISQGFMSNGINKSSRVMIISETRIEWMICFQSLIRCGATLATVFSNLGVDGVAHGIEETEVETVITSLECIPLLKSALNHTKKHCVNKIVYMDGLHKPDIDVEESIKIFALSDIETMGKQIIKENRQQPYPSANIDEPMLMMYTSGTTGQPKAATMTQRQFLGSIRALFVLVRHIMHEAPFHTYVSYLPMAHVLELTLELFFCFGGVRLGYASPFTLTDSAPGLARGQKPDIKLLRPTVMTTVPLVLDRIIKEVNEKLRSRTPVSQPVFQFLMNYKSMWTRLGYRCDIVSKLLCSKVREQLGSNLHFVICGGAPLNSNTQATIKSALDVTLIQGYGATETTGAVLCMDFDDLEYGRVGAPLGQVYFRLRDWPDGGYSVKDKPNPRGEILIGGDLVAINYFKRPEQTDDVFITDENGIRWFQTGDVGELYSNGTIKIIDRCKDLIKLQNGEYISLGKVEAALKFCQLVDNVCVYGGTFSNDIVALISPNRKALEQLAQSIGKNHLSIEEQCNDPQIQQITFNEVIKTAKQLSLGKKEIPSRVRLVPEVWSPDNGILTAALKLKRRIVEQMYKQQLYDLYNAKKFNIITSNGYDQNNNTTANGGGAKRTTTVTNGSKNHTA